MAIKNLTVKPNGRVKEGYLQYAFDADTNTLSYTASVTVSWFFIGRKTFKTSGEVQVDPKYFNSANYVVGAKAAFGEAKVTVKEIDDRKLAHCTVYFTKGVIAEYGSIVFDVSKSEPSIHAMNLRIMVSGILVNVLAG